MMPLDINVDADENETSEFLEAGKRRIWGISLWCQREACASSGTILLEFDISMNDTGKASKWPLREMLRVLHNFIRHSIDMQHESPISFNWNAHDIRSSQTIMQPFQINFFRPFLTLNQHTMISKIKKCYTKLKKKI